MRVKKPAELTKEQWAKYREGLKLSLHAIDKSLDLIADMNFQVGEIVERERIIKLLESNATGEYKKVMLTPKLISEIKGG